VGYSGVDCCYLLETLSQISRIDLVCELCCRVQNITKNVFFARGCFDCECGDRFAGRMLDNRETHEIIDFIAVSAVEIE